MTCIVNVAMGRRFQQSYVKGQDRLRAALNGMKDDWDSLRFYTNGYPMNCPMHADIPFAFKAYALKEASTQANLLLWCDACIIPIRSLEPIWRRAQVFGVWMGKSGWSNYEWTADSAYPDLFPMPIDDEPDAPEWSGRDVRGLTERTLEVARRINRRLQHVTATAFALDLDHPKGRDFLNEYYRLAQTKAFCGPLANANHPDAKYSGDPARCAPCGPADVRGHRHDQTAASVIMWRLGLTAALTESPEYFAYAGGETEKTVLVADGKY